MGINVPVLQARKAGLRNLESLDIIINLVSREVEFKLRMVYHQGPWHFSQKPALAQTQKTPGDLGSPQKGQERGDDDPVSWHGYRGSVRGYQARAGIQEMLQDRIMARWQGRPQRLTCFWFCVPVPAPW